MNKEQIKEFVQQNPVGVISTAGKDSLAAAAIYYVIGEDNSIYFNARRDSKKLANILENPSVAFTVFQRNPPITLQVSGRAEIIEDITSITDTYSELLKRTFGDNIMPPTIRMNGQQMALVKITPDWMRSGNFVPENEEDLFTTIVEKK